MTRTPAPLIAFVGLAAWGAGPAVAQLPPMQPPGQPIQLRPLGGMNQEQFYRSSVARWADQIVLEVESLKAEVSATNLGLGPKTTVFTRSDNAAAAARNLGQLARQGRDRATLYRAYTDVEKSVAELSAAVNQYPQARQVAADNLARVAVATQQLGATLASGDNSPDHLTRVVIRMSESLDEQSERLRDMLGDASPPGYDRNTDVSLRAFARAARQLGRTLRDTGNLDRARADYANVLGVGWANVGNQIARIANLPPEIRAQLVRVDGQFRRLGQVLQGGGMGPNPGPPPPGPLPGPLPLPRTAVIAVGAGEGGGPRVRVYSDFPRKTSSDFFAYDASFRGGVRVAMADLNGDGVPDVVTTPGPGAPPLVRVFDGRDNSLMIEFLALDQTWQGGVNVAAADLTPTGQALIAVAPDVGGGPQVKIFDLAQGKEIDSFFAFPQQLRGGVRLAWGDVNGDGIPDLVTAPGPCEHPPEVKVFSGKDRKLLSQFVALDPRWRGGLWVAAADVNKNGRADVVVGADAGGTPLVRVINPATGKVIAEWLAYPEDFRGGVRVACRDLDGDGRPEVICAPGPGSPNTPVVVFGGRDYKPVGELTAFRGFDGGGFVAAR
jgi:hypothetical protein